MWRQLELPEVPGRILGVSLPVSWRILIWTDQGVFKLWLGSPPLRLQSKDLLSARSRTSHETGVLFWHNLRYTCYGECLRGGLICHPPPRTETPTGELLDYDLENQTWNLRDPAGQTIQTVEQSSEQKWSFASFSKDGYHLVLGEPGRVRVYVREHRPTEMAARWQKDGDQHDQQSLLKAIREQPDDDLHRLVYADWLEEHGDAARAELIRIQCELWNIARPEWIAETRSPDDPPDPNTERIVHLRSRQRLLLTENGRRWRAELKDIRGLYWNMAFHRGFPGIMVNTPTTYQRMTNQEWADETLLECLVLYRVSDGFTRNLAQANCTRRLRVLSIHNCGYVSGDEFATYLNDPHMKHLRALQVRGHQPFPTLLYALSRTQSLTHLEWLRIDGAAVGDAQALAIANSPHLPRLKGIAMNLRIIDPATHTRLRERFGRNVS